MAASTATISYNSTLGVSTSSGGSYAEVAEVVNITDGLTVTPVKVTHLKSPNAAHEFKSGLVNADEITLTLNFTKAQYALFFSYLRTEYWWKITDADGSTTVCAGFVTKLGKKIEEDTQIMQDCTVKRTGLPTFTAAA